MLRARIESLVDLRAANIAEAPERLRAIGGDIECEIEDDGSFTLRGALDPAQMLNASSIAAEGGRHSLVAGARFVDELTVACEVRVA